MRKWGASCPQIMTTLKRISVFTVARQNEGVSGAIYRIFVNFIGPKMKFIASHFTVVFRATSSFSTTGEKPFAVGRGRKNRVFCRFYDVVYTFACVYECERKLVNLTTSSYECGKSTPANRRYRFCGKTLGNESRRKGQNGE